MHVESIHSMKNVITLLFCLFSISLFSQSIVVDTNTYTVPQLVNNVLINSPCVSAANINWSTGTNFGSTNGIGYFTNSNPNFPMQSGVILSTGNVLNSGGPNTTILSSGNVAWTGDSDLEAALLSAGITMNSTNATILEFDFTPISSNFDFDFLFASEEYGNFQCQFSDAFAFILTNTATGVSTNLAVVPGTSDPISVLTIRNFLYNSICPSENPQYFGSFNGGSNAQSSATNFNGQTVVMNASATLTPNTVYRIKLVIADRGDFQSDSAIFLSSGSFNIGQQVLGADLTVANNTAICLGQNTTLTTGLSASNFTFVWRKDGVILPGETNPSLVVSQPGTYDVTYTNILTPCQVVTDSIIVEFYPTFTTNNPRDLYKCNTGASSYNYNLALNTTEINLGANPAFTVTYFANATDANSNNNVLPTNYSSLGNETIFARIVNPQTGCYIVKSFQLLLATTAIATQPNNLTSCSTTTSSTTAVFNLNSLDLPVLNGLDPAIYSVLYFATLADANSGNSPLPTAFTTSNTTIYIRVQLNDDPACFSTTSAQLIVSPRPQVDTMQQVITCNSYTLPPLTNGNYYTGTNGSGTPMFAGDLITFTIALYIYNENPVAPFCGSESIFNIIIIDPSEIVDYTDTYCDSFSVPGITYYGGYYTQPNGGGTFLPSGTVLTTSQTIYFYFQSTIAPICTIEQPSVITITPTQQVQNFNNGFDCTSFELQPLSYGNYFTQPNGGGTQLNAGDSITTSQTVYVYGITGNCPDQSAFQIVVGLDFPTSVTTCVSYTLPQLIVGNYYTQPLGGGTQIPAGTVITTDSTIYVYAVSQSLPNCTDNYSFNVDIVLPPIQVPTVVSSCENYVLPSIPVGNYFTASNGNGTALFAGNILTTSQTVYVYLDDNNGCTNETSFFVTVFPRPVVDSRSNIDACHSYTLTNLANGNYYTGQNGTGTMYSGGTTLTTSQTIYIYTIQNGCPAETSFDLTIFTISAQQLPDVTRCDSYILPILNTGNHYFTQPNGQFGTGVEIPAGTVITTSQTIYIYVESGERINCSDDSSFDVTIIPTPIVTAMNDVFVCNSYVLPTLAVGNYFSATNGTGTQYNAGDVLTTNQTVYVYAETGTTFNCHDEKSFQLTIYNVDDLQDITICESYTLPTLSVGNYYNGANGTGGIIAQGTILTSSQTVYIFGNSGYTPNCSDETDFVVTIIDRPFANAVPIIDRTVCDEDGTNDGITNFDLQTLSATILGTQTGAEFNIAYFESVSDANANINSVLNSNLPTVYVRVGNDLAPNCYDVTPISIIVNKLPQPTAQDGIICLNNITGNVVNPYTIQSGLSASNHTFQWFDATGTSISTSTNYVANVAGIYSLIATNTTTGCVSEEVFINVVNSEKPIVSYTVSQDFSSNQTVTVVVQNPSGTYQYQLDNGPFQTSPIFENVSSGFHTITVQNYCGTTFTEAIVINYPKFFTPNGDGANDYWNIYDLRDQPNALITIFDRYGKVIKQIRTNGVGWDGTYNNELMISDDYWFVVNYQKNNEAREFKAHFALKR